MKNLYILNVSCDRGDMIDVQACTQVGCDRGDMTNVHACTQIGGGRVIR